MIFGIGMILLFAISGINLSLWIWAIVEIVQSEFNQENEKLIWVLLVVLLPFIGTVAYFAVGRKHRRIATTSVEELENELV